MKTNFILLFSLLFYSIMHSQVGINNNYPTGAFHVDPSGNNPSNGSTPSTSEQSDDFVISSTGVVSIGTISPSSYSSLEIESTKGVRLPQLTTAQRVILDALATTSTAKKNGLTIYNITTKCLDYWALTEWIELCGTPMCIPVSGTPVISPSSPTLIVNTATEFTASGVKNATGYVWKVNGTPQRGENSSTFTYTPTSTASVSITVIATGCNDSTTDESAAVTATPCAAVSSNDTPTITLTSGSLQVGTTATFTASEIANATTYTWYVNNSSTASQSKLKRTFDYIAEDTSEVTITVVASSTCNNSSSGTGTYKGTPGAACTAMSGTLSLGRSAATANAGSTVVFTASGVSNATRYVFTLNGKPVQDTASNSYSFFVNVEQNNTITVTAYDACGNTKTASNTVNTTTFTCKSVGRFLKPNTQCQYYYYCVTATGIVYTYNCPGYPTSKFYPPKAQCTINYPSNFVCPY